MSLPPQTSPLELFDTLRAEDETAWLETVFTPPPGFETIRGMRSVVVFGAEGSGKTTLRLALTRFVREMPGPGAPLIVEWQAGVPEEVDGGAFVAHFIEEILDLAAQALVRHLACQPERFQQASRFGQEGLTWLIHRYLQTDQELLLMQLEGEDATSAGLACLTEIFARTPKTLVSPTAPYPRQLTEVVRTLETAGFGGLWVLIDNLETWLTLDSAALGRMLTALFSCLAIFDIPGFSLRVMAPSSLKNLVSASTALARRRFDLFPLEWPGEALRALVERRLALACGQATFRLETLSADPELLPWFEKYAGQTPRGWLEFLRPFLDAYLAQPAHQPLSLEITTALQQRFPPRLRLDAALEQVFLGYQPVLGLSDSSLKLLRYLYTHPARACRKEELYYRGLRGLTREPRLSGDSGWEDAKTIEGIIDTALWRLRQSLEPNPSQPLYLVSDRGKGVLRLENAW